MAAGPDMPKAFKTLLGTMYWPSDQRMPSEHLLIADALGALSPDEHIVVKKYIDELVSPRHSDAEIKQAWDRTSPVFMPVDDAGYRRFLSLVSEIIGGSRGA